MNNKLLEASKIDRYVPALLVVGALVSALGFVLAFTVAPLVHGAAVTPELIAGQLVANQLLFSQKIFYFHVPVAMSSFIALIFTAFYGMRYLMTRDEGYDVRAKSATEVAVVFMIATMVTGVPWTRFEWGVWWSWEPRLTTYLILILMAIAYFILRTAFSDSEKRCSYASVFGIIMFIDAPICFMITRLIPSSTHPVVFRTDSGLPPDMLVPFLVCMLGIVLIAYALYRVRLRQSLLSLRIERLKEELDELE